MKGRAGLAVGLAASALACALGACWYGDPRARPPDASTDAPLAGSGAPDPRDAAPDACAGLDGCGPAEAGDPCAHAAAASWLRIVTKAQPPRGRARARLAFDPSDESLVLFGGVVAGEAGDEATLTSETLRLTDNVWSAPAPPRSPSPRRDHAMTTGDGRIYLFGGQGALELSDELWEWTGATWSELCTSAACRATRPPARATAGLAYDSERRRLVLVGGTGARGATDDTWEWDGAAWTRVCGAPLPSCGFVASHALSGGAAYDRVRRRTVFLHEHVPSLTYEFDGARWTRAESAAAPPFAGGDFGHVAGTAYDPIRGVTVSLGHAGLGNYRAWEWNGVCWWDTTSRSLDGDTLHAAIAYDPRHARLVRVGGEAAAGVFDREAYERPSR